MAAVALFLAILLAASAAHKLVAYQRLAVVAARLSGLRTQGVALLIVAGSLETVSAICLSVPLLRPIGSAIAVTVWLGYALALLRHRGETLDCGCDLVAREKRVDWPLISRPLVLAVLASLVWVLPAAPIDLDSPFAALGLLALYLAASELLAIPYPRWRNS